jgi:hypothetical protein
MINDSIKKICELPVDFKRLNKSTYTLVKDSGFRHESKDTQLIKIKEYLQQNPQLIIEWAILSQDKRTSGGYYLILDNENVVGSLDSGYRRHDIKFDTDIDACAGFIYLETSSILGLKI